MQYNQQQLDVALHKDGKGWVLSTALLGFTIFDPGKLHKINDGLRGCSLRTSSHSVPERNWLMF